jgi:hypothetical protein
LFNTSGWRLEELMKKPSFMAYLLIFAVIFNATYA